MYIFCFNCKRVASAQGGRAPFAGGGGKGGKVGTFTERRARSAKHTHVTMEDVKG